jgi:large subunit ribosomal protein L15
MVRKTEKFRGSRTHGRGKKAGRGKGKRGGTGNAGLHKHKYIWMLKYDPDHFGRHGFKRPRCTVSDKSTINVGDIERHLNGWLTAGKAKGDKAGFEVDLTSLKYDKLLGGGRATRKMRLKVSEASGSAVEKIKKAGGEVVLPAGVQPTKKLSGPRGKPTQPAQGKGGQPAVKAKTDQPKPSTPPQKPASPKAAPSAQPKPSAPVQPAQTKQGAPTQQAKQKPKEEKSE